ncbi:MAG TPA: hypothetical protein VLC53_19415 [Myxococcota bacterium]|nr:hypothetical protein [Myxococcota bacterium]
MRLASAFPLSSVVFVLGIAPSAGAALRDIEYDAEIHTIPPALASVATIGDPVFGSLTFDDATPDAVPDPSEGVYPGVVHEFSVGAYTGASTQSFLRIYDDGSAPPFDAWQVGDFGSGDELAPIAGLVPATLFFVLNGGTSMFSSDAIPPGLPPFEDPTLFEKEFRLELEMPGGGSAGQLRATITAVRLPEAGPSAAGGAAAAALLALARRRPQSTGSGLRRAPARDL